MSAFLKNIFPALIMCLAFTFSPALAQSGDQVKITGDNFDIDQKTKEAVFTGNVVVKQVKFTLWAPRVIAYYGDGGTSDLKKVTADGRIRLEQESQTAISDHGIYDPNTRILRMIGNVSVTQIGNGDVVNGPEMIVDLANDTSKFIGKGDNGRVTATFGSGD